MEVKIGNRFFSSEEEPIMIVLTDEEKLLISNMDTKSNKFCSFPNNYKSEEIFRFMVTKEDDCR